MKYQDNEFISELLL